MQAWGYPIHDTNSKESIMNLIRTATAVALGAIFSTAALAQGGPGFEQRDQHNQQRIEQGVRSGQITHREAVRLQRAQARIDRMEKLALNDGRVTRGERARIESAQNELSRAIRHEKHDAQTRR